MGVLCLVFALVAMSSLTASAEPTVRVRKDIPRDEEPATAGVYVFNVRIRLSVQTEAVTEARVIDTFSTSCANIVVISASAGIVDFNTTNNAEYPCRVGWHFPDGIPAGANYVLHLQVTKTVPAGDSCLNRGLQAGYTYGDIRSSTNGNNICFSDLPSS